MNLRFYALLAALAAVGGLRAQSAGNAQWRYIETYKALAMEQMRLHQVPASITLAQGLCESGAGQSRLAREAHNHFGIKAGTGWTGPYIVMADDRPDDRFRKYRTDAESYEDHSRFLRGNRRYAPLFELRPTDYKGWAHGLKRCGYATNPNYAPMLIGIIERYNLTQFDTPDGGGSRARARDRRGRTDHSAFYARHIIYKVNGCYMLVAAEGDTWEQVAAETGVSVRRLRKYNECPAGARLQAGDCVYLQKKRTRGDRALRGVPHQVQPGESLHDIAQRYGIRLRNLYRLNALGPDYTPQPGDLIWVR